MRLFSFTNVQRVPKKSVHYSQMVYNGVDNVNNKDSLPHLHQRTKWRKLPFISNQTKPNQRNIHGKSE